VYPLSEYLPALILTLGVELLVLVLVLRRGHRIGTVVLAGCLASGFTHPQLWYVWPHVLDPATRYLAYVISGELVVFVVEALILWLVLRRRDGRRVHPLTAVGAAAVANGASFLIGWVVMVL
jgi:hypothetical protein